ncbi:MAG: hypothetical protein A2Z95_02035 [Gallionellales bacterium GWA2_60_18]|nr:MAG: hypothetical protein A2Z95_02035 [Gallionellales bacterium GWA2_60_18]
MYVCVCNAVTDRDIGSAVAEGCCTMQQLREQLGVGTCCGRCTRCAREVLKDTLQASAPRRPFMMQLMPAARAARETPAGNRTPQPFVMQLITA